jgi:hypothetical protein
MSTPPVDLGRRAGSRWIGHLAATLHHDLGDDGPGDGPAHMVARASDLVITASGWTPGCGSIAVPSVSAMRSRSATLEAALGGVNPT